uniref:CSON014973 protein n=1 Tax=Culicoides sonorensis TaxID=179676 RepID=A0A336LP05_CULSO
MNKFIYCVFIFIYKTASGYSLSAYFSQNAIHGQLEFEESNGEIRLIRHFKVYKNLSLQDWFWHIHEFPVNYENINGDLRCTENELGKKLYNLEDIFGNFELSNEQPIVKISKNSVLEEGIKSLWGRSILLYSEHLGLSACSSILPNQNDHQYIAEARFINNIMGSIYFRSLSENDGRFSRTLIYTDLIYEPISHSIYSSKKSTTLSWKMYTTDVFDHNDRSSEANCNNLQIVFDPFNEGPGRSIGDLDARLGKLQFIAKKNVLKHKQSFVDKDLFLTLNDYSNSRRKLFIVLYNDNDPETYLTCAKLKPVYSKLYKANINETEVKGLFEWTQNSLFEPTFVNFSINNLIQNETEFSEEKNQPLKILLTELPPMHELLGTSKYCSNNSTGMVFNPLQKPEDILCETQDECLVGDVSSKLSLTFFPKKNKRYYSSFWDLFCPLTGSNSILFRGLLIAKKFNFESERRICTTILPFIKKGEKHIEQKITTAVVIFKYPIVGKIVFKQPTNTYWEDTTIIVEYLIHADGSSLNTTLNHRWAIHTYSPGNDFYDWQNRCMSTGDIFSFYKSKNISINKLCSVNSNIFCLMGDLSSILGSLTISGNINDKSTSRKLFTIKNLSLNGRFSVLGRSVTIYDEIEQLPSRKAVVREWFGNGQKLEIMGKIEFTQQSEYNLLAIETMLTGRTSNNIFSIHKVVPVAINLEFPCEISSLDHHYQLFGQQSIIGRSIVISDTFKNVGCGTIERGYSAKEARESRAVVSFHHPLGYTYGYIRLSQLIGLESGQSDTTIEINLRYPGLHDRNKTRNHLFKIFVNPVGVDAIVKPTVTRCTAGGYDELYKSECKPNNPFRCYVGDVSSRVGVIDIGYGKKVLTDYNFPLDGSVSSIGRSIVIFGPEYSSEPFACANIEPDHNIIKFVNIERPPRFVIGPIASKLEQDLSKLLVSGRLDVPSLYIPGYQNPKRKSTLHYKECNIKDDKMKISSHKNYVKSKSDNISGSDILIFSSFVLYLLNQGNILRTYIQNLNRIFILVKPHNNP